MTKTILVIDDDKMLRDTLAVGLRKEGFDVIRAESAEQAQEIRLFRHTERTRHQLQ